MPRKLRTALEICVLVLLANTRADAQATWPQWTPIPVTPGPNATRVTSAKVNEGGVAATAGWPYYSDSPLYSNPIYANPVAFSPAVAPMTAGPAAATVTATPYNYTPVSNPMTQGFPQTVMTPMAPQQPAPPYQPVPNYQSAPPQPQTAPSVVAAPTVPMPAVATPAAMPAVATPAAPPAPQVDAPFVNDRVFAQGGATWQVYDISSYTARFQPAAQPEQAIRQWILRLTGESVWNGMEVSTLVVSPSRIKVYHNPRVQAQVADILGRFLLYTPGQFDCRTTIVQLSEQDWRRKVLHRLQPAGRSEAGREAWLVDRTEATNILNEIMRESDGVVLANEEFQVANGQTATVRWISDQGRSAASTSRGDGGNRVVGYGPQDRSEEEGVVAQFSPLIGQDAASIDVFVDLRARRLEFTRERRLLPTSRPNPEVPQLTAAEIRGGFHVPPGRVLLFTLGRIPRFDGNKGLFGREKRAEILVLVEMAPGRGNSIAGMPLADSGTLAPNRIVRTAAKPFQSSGLTPHVPDVMTRAVH